MIEFGIAGRPSGELVLIESKMIDTQQFKDKNGNVSGLATRAKSRQETVKKLLSKWGVESIAEAIYLEDGGERGKCSCGRPTSFLGKGGYRKSCSVSCGAKAGAKRGKEHHLARVDVQEKRLKTNLQKYGVKNPQQVKEIKSKTQQTNLERYGSISPLGGVAGLMRSKKGMLEKFGQDNPSRVPSLREKAVYSDQQRWLAKRLDEIKGVAMPVFEPEKWNGGNNPHDWKCAKCEKVFSGWLHDGKEPRCTHCWPPTVSKEQKQVSSLLTELGVEHILNDRKLIAPLELDIVIPSKMVAIEVNGCYWHTEKGKGKDYHLMKSLRAEAVGYRLIHVFDDEMDAVLRRLRTVFSKDQIQARNTQFCELSSKEARQFLEQHHTSGTGPQASSYVGLKNGNELVAVASFGKNRWDKKTEWELIRLAFSTRVVGGASKLFKNWVQLYNPKSVLTYSERRWNLNDAVYRQLGFQLDGETALDYWYVGTSTGWAREPRQKYQAHKLREGPHDKRTERELTEALGLERIYGCGSLRWVWTHCPNMMI